MGKKSELEHFSVLVDQDTLKEYFDKVYDSLSVLNVHEEKHNFWLIVSIFIYIVFYDSSIESLAIGPVTLKDVSVIGKILPPIIAYIFFNLRTIKSQKADVNFTLKFLSKKLFLQSNEELITNDVSNTFLTRVFLPYSFTNSISKIIREKPSTAESFIGFPLLLPLMFIGIVPYFIMGFTIYDLYQNQRETWLGVGCLWITIWIFLLMLFYIVLEGVKSHEENK